MASLKKCIEQKCKDCTYDQYAPGSWRSQVQDCTVTRCALWEVRPITMETMLARRKGKTAGELDVASLIDGLDDEVEDDVVEA